MRIFMDFQRTMASFKQELDQEIEKTFSLYITEMRKKDAVVADALLYVQEIMLSGGKRLRGGLVYWSYLGLGGREKKKALKVAVAVEFVHMFLLIHDDIIDSGQKRHGKTTLHNEYAKRAGTFFKKGINEEYGKSMGILIGELVYVIALDMVTASGFEAEKIVGIISHLQSIVSTTIVGQSQDIFIGYKANYSEQDVLEMYENKTAKYTFEGPMHLGLILADCTDAKLYEGFSRYALPMGIAFQIQDDILGAFGNEKKMGKSAASDIIEGKKTLLVVKAKEDATKKQVKRLETILGDHNIGQKEIKEFQEILKDSGAYASTVDMAKYYIQSGKKEIEKLIIKKEAKDFFVGIADYLNNREI